MITSISEFIRETNRPIFKEFAFVTLDGNSVYAVYYSDTACPPREVDRLVVVQLQGLGLIEPHGNEQGLNKITIKGKEMKINISQTAKDILNGVVSAIAGAPDDNAINPAREAAIADAEKRPDLFTEHRDGIQAGTPDEAPKPPKPPKIPRFEVDKRIVREVLTAGEPIDEITALFGHGIITLGRVITALKHEGFAIVAKKEYLHDIIARAGHIATLTDAAKNSAEFSKITVYRLIEKKAD